jgi:hypothetical protein
MHWKTAGLCALALAGTLGCPHAFGRGGTLDNAASKDVEELFDPADCTYEQFQENCVPDHTTEKCRKICG